MHVMNVLTIVELACLVEDWMSILEEQGHGTDVHMQVYLRDSLSAA